MGSSVVVEFARVRAAGRWVHPGSLRSFGFALGVVGSLWGSLRSSAVVWFTWVRPVGHWVHPASLGLLGFAPCVVEFIGFALGVTARTAGRSADPGSLGSVAFALGVVGFIQSARFTRVRLGSGRVQPDSFHTGSRCGSFGSSGVVGFSRVRPWGRWVHPRSLDSLGFAMGVTGFIRGR